MFIEQTPLFNSITNDFVNNKKISDIINNILFHLGKRDNLSSNSNTFNNTNTANNINLFEEVY